MRLHLTWANAYSFDLALYAQRVSVISADYVRARKRKFPTIFWGAYVVIQL